MKQLILTITLLVLAIVVSAQTAEEEIERDIHRSGGNLLAYPAPSQTMQTPAPDGKKPFFISHYGRHGSRYLLEKADYDFPYGVLAKADSAGKLTPLGTDVLRRVAMIREEANLRLGELTPLGARQHQQIAQRMVERFHEVFQGAVTIEARSTTSIRCILSMENALLKLVMMCPDLQVRHYATSSDMWYLNYRDKKLEAQKKDSATNAAFLAFSKEKERGKNLMPKLFNDMRYVAEQVEVQPLANALFMLASNIQNTELRKKITLYDLFSDEELYDYWEINNAWWYIQCGGYLLNGGRQPYSQRHLLRQMILSADSCLALPRPGAILRYGHDNVLLSLVCLMGLNGFDLKTDKLEALDRKQWIAYRVFPMAANIQLVFYRANPQDQDVLVKVLLNENEAFLPFKSDVEPYYKWSDVRDFFLKKLDEYRED